MQLNITGTMVWFSSQIQNQAGFRMFSVCMLCVNHKTNYKHFTLLSFTELTNIEFQCMQNVVHGVRHIDVFNPIEPMAP
jgi:hypothetical protein